MIDQKPQSTDITPQIEFNLNSKTDSNALNHNQVSQS